MKYLTHLTVASEDDKFEDLRRLMGGGIQGQAAYGVYWAVAEMIGAQIRPESVSTSLTKTEKKWAEKLDIRVPFFQKWRETVRLVNLARVETNGKLITIDMPNILKYCDEYSRKVGLKSGRAPDKLRRDSGTPALPALQEVQDLRARETGGVLEAPPAHAKEQDPPPPNPTLPKCSTCDGPATTKVNGRLRCRKCLQAENEGTAPKEACVHQWLASGTCLKCCAIKEATEAV